MKKRTKLFSVLAGVILTLVVGLSAIYVKARSNASLPSQYVQDQPQDASNLLPLPLPPSGDAGTKLHIPILMYHYIEHVKDPGDTLRQKLDIKPEVLDQQLKTLTTEGYTFLTASDLDAIMDGTAKVPPKPVLLTFDDGYRDFYTDAFPLLKKYKVKSTQFVISGFIGHPNNMTLTQLKEIVSSGLVEIGAHTVHHIDLQYAPTKQATAEITSSKTQLESLLGVPITAFAYPGGRYNKETPDIVKTAGFHTAMSTHPGTLIDESQRYVLERLRPGNRVGKDLVKYMEQKVGYHD